ncbi:hypothetical protein BV394_00335 [Brevirhabdus pacifica]|uniref:Uncharacterized protein n=1 Tax=Brevirhabdus pacifica TaxID=1267768 RepID=A0A1U7DER4_9RHOB|nr:hypothetical protein [Brevirhabdus pacifica]APX88368.1 hypothetical protein BV394_00335 [Brevirhabdus pacifica]OWU79688.1 hypothetical protein ATO5_01030 [Loktanella sp. 22II-4b]
MTDQEDRSGRIAARLDALTYLQERLCETFVQKLRRAEADASLDPADLDRHLQVVSKLTVKTIEEGERLEIFRNRLAGDGGGGCLDLAAARDEVCRRLAGLRAARGGGTLSDGAE